MKASNMLLPMEILAYRYALLFVARLPTRVAYGLGRVGGTLQYQVESSKRRMVLGCFELAFGDRLTPEERIRLAHEHFRVWACKDLDRMRLAGNGQGFAKLVEVRGLEHVENALAQGKGAVIGSAHFGSWEAEVGLLGILGFPVRLIADRKRGRELSLREMLVRPKGLPLKLLDDTLRRHLRPAIIVDKGSRHMVADEAARVLAQNELVFVMMDVVTSPARHPGSVPMPFLNGLAHLPTGAIRIAKSTGAPLLFCLIHRSRDWRHQTMTISAPIPTEGDTYEINRRCTRLIENTIRREPAQWRFWTYELLASIGLIPMKELKRRVGTEGRIIWY